MAERETSQSIDDDAAIWVARRDRAPLTASEEAELETWMAGDDRRPGALLRAQALYIAAGAQGSATSAPPLPPAPLISRRSALTWGGSAIAAGVAGLAFTLQAPRAQATQRGEIRLIPLADGSTMTLNTDSAARIRYRDDRRLVELLRGEAFFSAALDADRPFVVDVAGRRLSTPGGAFRVSRLPDLPVEVTVQNGQLSLSAGAPRPLVVGANTRTALGDGPPAVHRVSAREVERDLAWREGRIAFQGETLAQAAQAFSRYGEPTLTIADPELAREPITGLFAANDPAGFSRAIAAALGATSTRHGHEIVLSRAGSH